MEKRSNLIMILRNIFFRIYRIRIIGRVNRSICNIFVFFSTFHAFIHAKTIRNDGKDSLKLFNNEFNNEKRCEIATIFRECSKKKRKQTFVSVAITCLSLNHVVIFERLTNHSHRLTHPTSRRGDAMTRSFSISPSYCVSKRRGRVRENVAISYARDVPG